MISESDNENRIKVFVRVRPLTPTEGGKERIGVIDNAIRVESSSKRGKKSVSFDFNFDGVFPTTCSQSQINKVVGQSCVRDLLKGYNSTIFAYGQTGSGKTYTMYGRDEDARNWRSRGNDRSVSETSGLVPRITAELFRAIQGESKGEDDDSIIAEGTELVIKCTFLEIYNENVRDLLDSNQKANSKLRLRIRETKAEGVWVEGLTEEFATCEQDIADFVRMGFQVRSVGRTKLNERSSRSHCVFTIVLQQTLPDGKIKTSRLNLVDLAGSERVGRSGVEGIALKEAQNINTSLACLGNCIGALLEARPHVPYRDSKLTHLLKESLGGNARTHIVVTVSPAPADVDETVGALRFGSRAKSVTTHAIVNVKKSNAELLGELRAIKTYVRTLEAEIKLLRSKTKGDVNEKEGIKVDTRPPSVPNTVKETAATTPPSIVRHRFVQLQVRVEELEEELKDKEERLQMALHSNKMLKEVRENSALTALEMDVKVENMKDEKTNAKVSSPPPSAATKTATADLISVNENRAAAMRELSEAWSTLHTKNQALRRARSALEAEQEQLASTLSLRLAEERALRRRQEQLERLEKNLEQREKELNMKEEELKKRESDVEVKAKSDLSQRKEEELNRIKTQLTEMESSHEIERQQWLVTLAEKEAEAAESAMMAATSAAMQLKKHQTIINQQLEAAEKEAEEAEDKEHSRLVQRTVELEAELLPTLENGEQNTKVNEKDGTEKMSQSFQKLWKEAAKRVAIDRDKRRRLLKLTGSGDTGKNGTNSTSQQTKLLTTALRLRREQLLEAMTSPKPKDTKKISSVAGSGANYVKRSRIVRPVKKK
eukprot:g5231.t1